MLGVIEPGARAAAARTGKGRVGVLGTSATVASGAYRRELLRVRPGLKVVSLACPLFVPLIEEGWAGHEVARKVAREYLRPLARTGVDTVILGCTHYPLLKAVIRGVLGPRITLVDSAEAVAGRLSSLLRARGLARAGRRPGRESFYLTDTGGSFLRVAERFLGRAPHRIIRVNMRLASVDGAGRQG
jgi:glutamate racemase